MAGDIWEQAVETYLCMDRGLFLNPQYLIGTPGVREANPDFLALEFPKRNAWMVEVTKSPRQSLFIKIDQFNNEYAVRIEAQLCESRIIPAQGPSWRVGLWVFAPQETLSQIERRMERAKIDPRKVTSLEETLAPSAWNIRFASSKEALA